MWQVCTISYLHPLLILSFYLSLITYHVNGCQIFCIYILSISYKLVEFFCSKTLITLLGNVNWLQRKIRGWETNCVPSYSNATSVLGNVLYTQNLTIFIISIGVKSLYCFHLCSLLISIFYLPLIICHINKCRMFLCLFSVHAIQTGWIFLLLDFDLLGNKDWHDQKDWILHKIDWSCNLLAKVSFLTVLELILASTLSCSGLKYFKLSLPETRGNPKYLTCHWENKLVICKARMSYHQAFAMRVEFETNKQVPQHKIPANKQKF